MIDIDKYSFSHRVQAIWEKIRDRAIDAHHYSIVPLSVSRERRGGDWNKHILPSMKETYVLLTTP